jgi:hypothetical protein
MSMPPEPPKRLAEILLEILALSNPARTSRSESAGASNSIQLFDAHDIQEQPHQTDEEDNNRQRS